LASPLTTTDTNRGSAVVFEGNETDASVLDGFTITGGTGSRLVDSSVSVDSWVGGGIFFDASSGTVRNCAQSLAGIVSSIIKLMPFVSHCGFIRLTLSSADYQYGHASVALLPAS